MYRMPKRPSQHIQEHRSFAILLYKLREIGIFRNQTVSDYGIDFEYEIAIDNYVTGKIVKVQVKATDSVAPNRDGRIAIGNLKQSTLAYWAEVSFSTPVVIALVDTSTEDIYISKPVFWQCLDNLDGTDSEKTLYIPKGIPSGEDNSSYAIVSLLATGYLSSLRNELSFISQAMRSFGDYCSLLVDVEHYDPPLPVDEFDVLRHLMEVCNSLRIHHYDTRDGNSITPEEKKNIYNMEWWCAQYGFDYDGIIEGPPNITMRKPIGFLVPRLLEYLKQHRARVMRSGLYWKDRMPRILSESCYWKYAKAIGDEDIRKIGYQEYNGYRFHRDVVGYYEALSNGESVDEYLFLYGEKVNFSN